MIALVFLLAVAAATAAPTTSVQSQAHDDMWRDVTTGCGQYKACFLYPADCYTTKDCVIGVSILVTSDETGTTYTFEAQSIGGKYIAVGLSEDTTMGGTSVTECVNDSKSGADKLSLYVSYNKGTANDRESEDQSPFLIDSSYDVDNAIAKCTYTRKEVTTYQGQLFDLAQVQYYILLAAGKTADDDSIGYHDVALKASADKRFVADIGFFQLPQEP